MTAYSIRGPVAANGSYSITAYRFILGLRYNPVRLISQTATESR
jgi:hypothetical protein